MSLREHIANRLEGHLPILRQQCQNALDAGGDLHYKTVEIIREALFGIFDYHLRSMIKVVYPIEGDKFFVFAATAYDRVHYLLEVIAVDEELANNHLHVVTDYAAKEGIKWVVLSNGVEWQAYQMKSAQPVRYDHVFTINFMEDDDDLEEKINTISRHRFVGEEMAKYIERGKS